MGNDPDTLRLTLDIIADRLAMWADVLDSAPRCGKSVDDPVGARFVALSDTLVKQWAAEMRALARTAGGGEE